jgi:undecaprenyl diphosphate synthase
MKKRKLVVNLENFEKCLYTYPAPPIDLLVRTSGEMRLSNYMLYQASYAELYFPKVYWPAFTKKELYKALEEFEKRNRRFGNI